MISLGSPCTLGAQARMSDNLSPSARTPRVSWRSELRENPPRGYFDARSVTRRISDHGKAK
jgi:hypothetical protein